LNDFDQGLKKRKTARGGRGRKMSAGMRKKKRKSLRPVIIPKKRPIARRTEGA